MASSVYYSGAVRRAGSRYKATIERFDLKTAKVLKTVTRHAMTRSAAQQAARRAMRVPKGSRVRWN